MQETRIQTIIKKQISIFKRFGYWKLFIGIFLVIVSCFLYLYFLSNNKNSNNSDSFTDAYADYKIAVKQHERATYLPGLNSNTTRRELDMTLAGVLTEDISTSERLNMSKEGIKLAKDIENQIDDIGKTAALVESAVVQLEKSSEDVHGNNSRNMANGIIDMAKEQLEVGSDIRGLSYRANYYTVEIFKRVIADKGKLTSAHILDLNHQISEAEVQFDRRTSLYDRFENLSNKRDNQYSSFENSL